MLFSLLALLAGCLALWAGWRVANPRTTWPETLLLGLLGGCAALLHPAALPIPLCLALGVAAVWPGRALAVLSLGLGVVILGLLQGYASWPPLPPFSFSLLASSGLVGLGLLIYQLYHWRWWPPRTHLQVGLGGWALLLTSSTLGQWPTAWALSTLFVPLPVWAWWLAKPRKGL